MRRVQSNLNLASSLQKKKERKKKKPVNSELHLWCTPPRTVIMHKTSNNHWFIFAFNYFLARATHACGCVCVCVWLCMCESVGAGPTECTDRAEALPPSLVRHNTTANHKASSAVSTGTKGQIWSLAYFQSWSVLVESDSFLRGAYFCFFEWLCFDPFLHFLADAKL